MSFTMKYIINAFREALDMPPKQCNAIAFTTEGEWPSRSQCFCYKPDHEVAPGFFLLVSLENP